jgi:hypothetical protein
MQADHTPKIPLGENKEAEYYPTLADVTRSRPDIKQKTEPQTYMKDVIHAFNGLLRWGKASFYVPELNF